MASRVINPQKRKPLKGRALQELADARADKQGVERTDVNTGMTQTEADIRKNAMKVQSQNNFNLQNGLTQMIPQTKPMNETAMAITKEGNIERQTTTEIPALTQQLNQPIVEPQELENFNRRRREMGQPDYSSAQYLEWKGQISVSGVAKSVAQVADVIRKAVSGSDPARYKSAKDTFSDLFTAINNDIGSIKSGALTADQAIYNFNVASGALDRMDASVKDEGRFYLNYWLSDGKDLEEEIIASKARLETLKIVLNNAIIQGQQVQQANQQLNSQQAFLALGQ